MSLNIIFIINLATSLFMTGLIWLIQLVHYPSFRFVEAVNFNAFHAFHNRRISFIVVPVMIFELISSAILWWHQGYTSLNGMGFYMVISIWAATAFLSVPNHAKLTNGKDDLVINSLINTNWVRTILWTMKAILSLYILSVY